MATRDDERIKIVIVSDGSCVTSKMVDALMDAGCDIVIKDVNEMHGLAISDYVVMDELKHIISDAENVHMTPRIKLKYHQLKPPHPKSFKKNNKAV